MTEKTKKRLALENNFEKDRRDDKVKSTVNKEVGFPEENAIVRKTIYAILGSLDRLNMQIPRDLYEQFTDYYAKVEDIKYKIANE